MPFRKEDLAEFVGGELEIVNPGAGSIYRGAIRSIEWEEGMVQVALAWQARAVGFPPSAWIAAGVRVSHMIGTNNFKSLRTLDGLEVRISGERCVAIFRRNSSRNLLSPTRVAGLRYEESLEEELQSTGWQFLHLLTKA